MLPSRLRHERAQPQVGTQTGAPSNNVAPFGGFKQSGNGREHGLFGFEEFLEVKAVIGYRSA